MRGALRRTCNKVFSKVKEAEIGGQGGGAPKSVHKQKPRNVMKHVLSSSSCEILSPPEKFNCAESRFAIVRSTGSRTDAWFKFAG